MRQKQLNQEQNDNQGNKERKTEKAVLLIAKNSQNNSSRLKKMELKDQKQKSPTIGTKIRKELDMLSNFIELNIVNRRKCNSKMQC